MMRTNHRIWEEMRGTVMEKIPWRLSLGPGREGNAEDHRHGRMKDGVRDLEIRWNLPDPCEPFRSDVVERLDELELDRCKRRRRCLIRMERGSYLPTLIEAKEMEALATWLEVFEEVDIRIRMGKTMERTNCPARLYFYSLEQLAVELGDWLEAAWGNFSQRRVGDECSLRFTPFADGRSGERMEGKRNASPWLIEL